MERVTLYDLVMQIDKEQALTYFMEYTTWGERYEPDYEESDRFLTKEYEECSRFYDSLKMMVPKECPLELVVWHGLTEDNKIGYDVRGKGYSKEYCGEVHYSICGLPWDEWLGLVVCEETLKTLSPAQIVGYALYEMTYLGFSEEEVDATLAKLSSKSTSENEDVI